MCFSCLIPTLFMPFYVCLTLFMYHLSFTITQQTFWILSFFIYKLRNQANPQKYLLFSLKMRLFSFHNFSAILVFVIKIRIISRLHIFQNNRPSFIFIVLLFYVLFRLLHVLCVYYMHALDDEIIYTNLNQKLKFIVYSIPIFRWDSESHLWGGSF